MDVGGDMSNVTTSRELAGRPSPRPQLDEKPHYIGAIAFLLVLAAGLGFVAFSISGDGDAGSAWRRFTATG
jgi:hypothetical protein